MVAAGAAVQDLGVTTPPRQFVTPEFNINPVQARGGAWSVSVQHLRAAAEGNNTAIYLAPGLHRTGLMMAGGFITHYVAGGGNREIYRQVTEQVSTLSRQAELEHCNDIIHAYAITLQAAETAINGARISVAGQRYGSRRQAMAAALAALTNGMAAALAQVFRDNVNVDWNVNRHGFQRDLAALYLATANMTQNRDNAGWHTFSLQRAYESWSATSWANYSRYTFRRIPLVGRIEGSVYGVEKDIRDMTMTAPFQVPGPASAVVVHL
jgi:hypothetical protein